MMSSGLGSSKYEQYLALSRHKPTIKPPYRLRVIMLFAVDRKEKQLFLDFGNAQSSVNSITAIENFIIGFRLGVRIGIEVMGEEDGMLNDII